MLFTVFVRGFVIFVADGDNKGGRRGKWVVSEGGHTEEGREADRDCIVL